MLIPSLLRNVYYVKKVFLHNLLENSATTFFLSMIAYLFPVGLVSRGVNIVPERLDASRRRLTKILQDCKFLSRNFFGAERSGPLSGPGP